MSITLRTIGTAEVDEKGFYIELEDRYLPAMKGTDGFGHLMIIWWGSFFENDKHREIVEVEKPYKNAPDILGIFATRSPIRPNPILVTNCAYLGLEGNKVRLAYIDCEPGTPILDIKPYSPCLDLVTSPKVPVWCQNFPMSIEASATFDWSQVFENAR